MAREVFTSYPPLELSLTGRFVARLLLRAAREDVGDEEEEESGQPGKVRSFFTSAISLLNLDSFKVVATGSNNNPDSLGMTEISPNFSAMMLENREFHNPVYPVH